MTWATPAQARAIWADAPTDDGVLEQLLLDATEQLLEYAPPLAPTLEPVVEIPNRWVRACVLQARELSQAAARDGDVVGIGDYAIRARPLTASVMALLRPERAVPALG